MLQKTEAIVLNKIKYSDTYNIVNLYGNNIGRFSALIRTNTKKSDIKQNIFFPLNIIETETNIKATRSIQKLVNCSQTRTSSAILSDINKISIAQFIAEIIIKTIHEEESNIQLYDFLKETITQLAFCDKNIQNFHLIFLKEYAKYLGFGITNNYHPDAPFFNLKEGLFIETYTTDAESLDEKYSFAFSTLLNINYHNNDIKFSYPFRKKVIEYMLSYYKMHIDDLAEIKSLHVLNDIFAE